MALVVIRLVEERVAALELELRLREPLPDVIHGNERPGRNVRTVDADGLGKEKVQRQLINALCAGCPMCVYASVCEPERSDTMTPFTIAEKPPFFQMGADSSCERWVQTTGVGKFCGR